MPELTSTENITETNTELQPEVTQTEAEKEITEITETAETAETEKVKTFTEAEVQKMIQERLSREKKAKEEAVKEAEKLAKMTKDQQRDYEYQKIKEENESLKAEQSRSALRKEAHAQLTDKGLVVNDEILSLVTQGTTAEEVKEAIDNVADLINGMVTSQLQKELAGSTPKRTGSVVTGSSKALTKDDILNIKDPIERQKAIRENFNLFE